MVPGFEVKLCDADGHVVRDGGVGALWVRGESRAIGYWQQMDDTAHAFRGEWTLGRHAQPKSRRVVHLLRPFGDMFKVTENGSRQASSRTAC